MDRSAKDDPVSADGEICRWDEISEEIAVVPATVGGTTRTGAAGGTGWSASDEARSERRIGPRAQLIGALLLSLVTGVSTLLGTLLIVFPDLKQEAPPALGASLGTVALEERAVPVAGSVANLIAYEVEFVGYKKKQASIKYAIFDAVRQRRIDPPTSGDPKAEKF